jgi:hypothetical protein
MDKKTLELRNDVFGLGAKLVIGGVDVPLLGFNIDRETADSLAV